MNKDIKQLVRIVDTMLFMLWFQGKTIASEFRSLWPVSLIYCLARRLFPFACSRLILTLVREVSIRSFVFANSLSFLNKLSSPMVLLLSWELSCTALVTFAFSDSAFLGFYLNLSLFNIY